MAIARRVYRTPRKVNTAEKLKRELATRKKVLKKKYPRGIARALREKNQVQIITLEMRRITNEQGSANRALWSYLNNRSPVRMAAVYGLMVSRKNNARDQFIARCARIIEGGRIIKLSPANVSHLITIEFNKLNQPPPMQFRSVGRGNT